MKKSNALMLSYIIILILTLVAGSYFGWDGIDQVALAATIAGFCFAIADYYGWEASYNQPMVDAQKEYLNSYRCYLNEVLTLARKDGADIKKAIELLEPYCNSHQSVVETLDEAYDLADVIDQAKTKANSSLMNLPSKMEAVQKKERKIRRSSCTEAIAATMGFLVFFIIIIFDTLAEKLIPTSSIATIAAFILIMLNYFAKDLSEAKIQKDVSETAALTQEMKEKVAEYKVKLQETNLAENAKKMVADIEKLLNKEEDVENG